MISELDTCSIDQRGPSLYEVQTYPAICYGDDRSGFPTRVLVEEISSELAASEKAVGAMAAV